MASSPRIDELRKKFEENPRRYFAPLANEYRKAGDVQQAIAICREYLPQQPGHMSGHIVFGQALYEARTFDEAKVVFETALTLDPENLIALRHLGDISLITGDTEGARNWYKRVLEADPRNEEIQAQLATIEQAASSAPTPPVAPAVTAPAAPAPAPSTPSAPPPASAAPTVVMKAVAPPSRTAPVTATSPTAEIDLDMITPPPPPAQEASHHTPAPQEAAPSSAPTVELTPPVAAERIVEEPEPQEQAAVPLEGLEETAVGSHAPVDSFSLDGLETTSLSTEPPPPPAPLPGLDLGMAGEEPAPVAAAPAPAPIDLDFGGADAAAAEPESEPAPAALPELDIAPVDESRPAAPAIDLPSIDVAAAPDEPPALDLDLGSMEAPAPSVPPPSPAPAEARAEPDAPLDLEISIPETPLPSAPAAPAAPAAAEAPMAPPAPAISEPAVGALSVEPLSEPAEPASPVSTSGPFVTETMADLYVQQGHHAEALRVYRALLEQRPGDAGILGKIASLEGSTEQRGEAPSPGPSVRELLLAVAMRRPGFRPEWPSNGAPGPGATASIAAPSGDSPAAPPDGGRADVLGARLGFAHPHADSDAAALVLSRAFSGNGGHDGAPLIVGQPARPARDELSLKKVFRNTEGDAPPNFSFDQFFSQRASAEHPVVGGAEGQGAESPEEVAQFTQWLEGLKRR